MQNLSMVIPSPFLRFINYKSVLYIKSLRMFIIHSYIKFLIILYSMLNPLSLQLLCEIKIFARQPSSRL